MPAIIPHQVRNMTLFGHSATRGRASRFSRACLAPSITTAPRLGLVGVAVGIGVAVAAGMVVGVVFATLTSASSSRVSEFSASEKEATSEPIIIAEAG